jgi:hypothetical protein
MALVDGLVSFTALSEERSAAWFAEQLGITPSGTWEAGDLAGPSGRRHPHSGWSLDFRSDNDTEPFDAVLLRLIQVLSPHKDQLLRLHDSFHYRIVCSGSSDSTQGGFWLSPECLAGLGWLGAELLITVSLDDGEG